jgi:hypothetical protein
VREHISPSNPESSDDPASTKEHDPDASRPEMFADVPGVPERELDDAAPQPRTLQAEAVDDHPWYPYDHDDPDLHPNGNARTYARPCPQEHERRVIAGLRRGRGPGGDGERCGFSSVECQPLRSHADPFLRASRHDPRSPAQA